MQIVVPSLPGKALKRQLPFRQDDGLFEDSFIEERRVGLEQFINKSVSWCSVYSSTSCSRLTGALLCVCVCTQDCRSPTCPERTLSSHVPAGGNHRPQLRSWKSTALGLLGGGGRVRVGKCRGVTIRLSGLCSVSPLLSAIFLSFFFSLFQPVFIFIKLHWFVHLHMSWVTLSLCLSLPLFPLSLSLSHSFRLNFIFVQ